MGNVKSKEEVPDEAIDIREDTTSNSFVEKKVTASLLESGIESLNGTIGAAAGTSVVKDQQETIQNTNSQNFNQKQVNQEIGFINENFFFIY